MQNLFTYELTRSAIFASTPLGLSKLLKNDIRMFVWKKITNSNYSNIWLPILRSCRQYVNNATKPWFKLAGYIYIL